MIKLPNGNKFFSAVSKECSKISPGDTVFVDQKSLCVVDVYESESNSDIEKYVIIEKPDENWEMVGGLDQEIKEIKEVIELPIKKPELFEKMGIKPPKGILSCMVHLELGKLLWLKLQPNPQIQLSYKLQVANLYKNLLVKVQN